MVAHEKVESWSPEMVFAVGLIKVVVDEKAENRSSEMVVVGVFEEVFCRRQGMVVKVDVLVRAWET